MTRTILPSLYCKHCSVGPLLHCDGSDRALVDVVGMEGAHSQLSVGSCGVELEQAPSHSLRHVQLVPSDDPIHLAWRGRVPGQGDVGGVQGGAGEVGRMSTRS